MRPQEIGNVIGSAIQRGPQALASALERLGGDGAFPSSIFTPPRADRYTRKLIYEDPQGAFVVIACTWAPGQVSGLHDHHGYVGAEMVVSGVMEETAYDLKACDNDGLYRFMRGRTRIANKGAIGTIVPPQEFHDFGNPGTEPALTLHVYGGNLVQCRVFASADEKEMWRAKPVRLSYDCKEE